MELRSGPKCGCRSYETLSFWHQAPMIGFSLWIVPIAIHSSEVNEKQLWCQLKVKNTPGK